MPGRLELSSIESARAILDRFNVAGRLQHVRQFVWRGGHLELRVEDHGPQQLPDVAYALTAEWPAPILDRSQPPPTTALAAYRAPVVEGRWIRGTAGYQLRVGIDLAVPSAIYIRAERLLSYVPFLGRPPSQVEQAVSNDLTAYVNAFLSHHQPIPQATAQAAHRLRRLGLAA